MATCAHLRGAVGPALRLGTYRHVGGGLLGLPLRRTVFVASSSSPSLNQLPRHNLLVRTVAPSSLTVWQAAQQRRHRHDDHDVGAAPPSATAPERPHKGHHKVVNAAAAREHGDDGGSGAHSHGKIHGSTAASFHTDSSKKMMPHTQFAKLGGQFVKLAVAREEKEKTKASLDRISVDAATPGEPDDETSYDVRQRESYQKVSMAKTLSILVPEAKTLGVALGAITVSVTATMQFPVATGRMIDLLSVGVVASDGGTTMAATAETLAEMHGIAYAMMGYFTVGALATFVHSSLLDACGERVGANLRKKLFHTIMNQDATFFDENRAGELANRLSTDVHEVAEHLVQNVALLLNNAVRSASAVGMMIVLSPSLTLYSASVIPAVAACAAFYGHFIKRLSRKHLDALAHSTHIATERFAAIATVLCFGQTSTEVGRYSKVIDASYVFARRVAVYQGAFVGTSYLVGNAALLGVLWIGAGLVFDGAMTAGQLAGFCMYAGHLAGGVSEITESAAGFLRAQGSGSRLFALLEKGEPTAPKTGGDSDVRERRPVSFAHLPEDYEGVVRFEDVSFSYPAHPDTPVLRDLSLTLSRGEMLAVTGRSGCGKSSLMALLLRLYEPTAGRITLDGVDIRDLEVDWLRSQIGTVWQEPLLFDATVMENIAYGRPHATQEEVEEACFAANVHEFIIRDLPDGYDTVVGERGTALSGGQRQRLAIARALLTKPRMLVLDEATSSLDGETEHLVFGGLRRLIDRSGGRVTALVITHHLSALTACDRVAVLDEGFIVEKGTFDSLAHVQGTHMHQLVRAGSVHSHPKESPVHPKESPVGC